MQTAGHRAIFLDRDGTLIVDSGYPAEAADVRLLDGAAEVLLQLRERGYLLVVISNQSGVGRGLVTVQQAERVSDRFVSLFAERGVKFDGVYYCPHHPDDGCECRKPLPGLFFEAALDLGIVLPGSFMVGDKISDAEAGQAAGCIPVLLRNEIEPGQVPAHWKVIQNLSGLLALV